MRRNLNKTPGFLQAILNNNCYCGVKGPPPRSGGSPSGGLWAALQGWYPLGSNVVPTLERQLLLPKAPPPERQPRRPQGQPLASISFTAALFLAPICSADTPSPWKGPNRFRIGLLPVPRSGYSLLASA